MKNHIKTTKETLVFVLLIIIFILVFHEHISYLTIVGLLVIIGGVLMIPFSLLEWRPPWKKN
jgi:multidrug transporter EmrE-like cation transporter